MASEMIERVARALMTAELTAAPDDTKGEFWDTLARAAIEAMMEPTAAMLETQLWTDAQYTARYVWRDMIDAALKDARDTRP